MMWMKIATNVQVDGIKIQQDQIFAKNARLVFIEPTEGPMTLVTALYVKRENTTIKTNKKIAKRAQKVVTVLVSTL